MKSQNIPIELKKLKQWVCWRGEPGANGKLRKIPVNPYTGGGAMSNNPDTWSDFETAVRVSKNYSGIGFMFAPPYFGVDIDNIKTELEAFQNGDTNNIVGEFIYSLSSYCEYSQSGNGLHIICRGELPPGGCRHKNVEMYQTGRYFIMTGDIIENFAINDCTKTIKPLHEKYIGGGTEPSKMLSAQVTLSEQEIINRALESKQSKMFGDFLAGNWEPYGNSHSEADMTFCNMLAFWCGRDAYIMDKIFRSSGMMREKWDRKTAGSTYGAITINKAVRNCKEVYTPKEKYSIKIDKKKLYTFDDMGNAELLFDLFGEQVRYSYINKLWNYYDGRVWKIDNKGIISQLCDIAIDQIQTSLPEYLKQPVDPEETEKLFRKHMKYCRSNKAKKAMIEELKHHVPITPDEMDRDNHLLNTPSGVLHLRTGELKPHSYDRYFSKITHVEYTDKADCPRWISFLNDIFEGDQELIRYVQKAVGYSLTGSTEEQCVFFCYGDGRNGKSTFLEVLSTMLGDYATNIQPETIMQQRQAGNNANSDIARLKGARFVTSVEPNEGMKVNEGLLKQLTGGDRVTARYQYGREFEFKPEFKLWMGTNHKPIIAGTDLGIWRRMHLIPFEVCIPDEKVDKRLPYRLREELPGILHWAMEGCLLWQKEGLEKPTAVETATKEYRAEMDVITSFLDACCVIGAGRVKTTDIYKAYAQWGEENNEYVMSARKFTREMIKRFKRVKYQGTWYYNSIDLSNNCQPYRIWVG